MLKYFKISLIEKLVLCEEVLCGDSQYEVMQEFRDHWVLMYFDDVTIFSSSENI